jgi:hypothetical protein
VVLGWM